MVFLSSQLYAAEKPDAKPAKTLSDEVQYIQQLEVINIKSRDLVRHARSSLASTSKTEKFVLATVNFNYVVSKLIERKNEVIEWGPQQADYNRVLRAYRKIASSYKKLSPINQSRIKDQVKPLVKEVESVKDLAVKMFDPVPDLADDL
jgi:hypothetical protein